MPIFSHCAIGSSVRWKKETTPWKLKKGTKIKMDEFRFIGAGP